MVIHTTNATMGNSPTTGDIDEQLVKRIFARLGDLERERFASQFSDFPYPFGQRILT